MILQKDADHNIAIWDPFSIPQALVVIACDGMEMLPPMEDKNKITYSLIVDEMEETTWQAIRSRIEERSNDNTLVRINLSDGVDAVSIKLDKELVKKNFLDDTFLSNLISHY